MRDPKVWDSERMSHPRFLERVRAAIRYYGRCTVVFSRPRNAFLVFPAGKNPAPEAGEIVGVYEAGISLRDVAADMEATKNER